MVAVALATVFHPTDARAQEQRCGSADLATHRLAYCVAGRGFPIIVLESGMRSDRRAWQHVIEPLARLSTVLTYDRAGLGESEAGPAPRTSHQIASELRQLLGRLGLSGPFLLAGHSIGGRHVRTFAATYPDEVGGLVLLDSPPDSFEIARLTLLAPAERAGRQEALLRSRSALPRAVQLEYEGLEASPPLPPGSLPDIPVVVVSAGRHGWVPQPTATAHEGLWRRLQQDLAAATPGGRFIVFEEVGHNMHVERPGLVVGVIAEVLRELRR